MDKPNPTRSLWSGIFLIVGIFLLAFFFVITNPVLLNIIKRYLSEILWCLSWGAIGIGLGLYNSVGDLGGKLQKHEHYYKFFSFVWFIATLAAFVALGTFENSTVRSYVAAALAGVIVGFVGDKLPEKFFGLAR